MDVSVDSLILLMDSSVIKLVKMMMRTFLEGVCCPAAIRVEGNVRETYHSTSFFEYLSQCPENYIPDYFIPYHCISQ